VILLDTNILVHAAGIKSPRHARAKELRDRAASGEIEGCIAAQVLAEFYAIMTDPRRFQPPLAPAHVRRDLQSYLSSRLWLILPKETTVSRMLDLLGPRLARGGKIFDLFLAATMLDNGVGTIYTENVRDFEGLDGVEAINPLLPEHS
jgi:predicted nucleic acid-binding protein